MSRYTSFKFPSTEARLILDLDKVDAVEETATANVFLVYVNGRQHLVEARGVSLDQWHATLMTDTDLPDFEEVTNVVKGKIAPPAAKK
jgi:hypothetical protein